MKKTITYRDAGVDIDAGNHTVALLRDAVNATHNSSVLAGVGAFGGLFSLSEKIPGSSLVLAASTDGVGTKVRLGANYSRFRGLGEDLVNHCINDILVQGARPLFFLDYVASAKLEPQTVAEIVIGMANACRASGCALLGGETAEMPGVYMAGELDVAGTIVGAVESQNIIDGRLIEAGDCVLGLPSVSPHTNGYSLIRKLVEGLDLTTTIPELDEVPIDALLRPHKSYLPEVDSIEAAGVRIKGLVHVTGGGLIENPPRILNEDLAMNVDLDSWRRPSLYRWLAELGHVPLGEMLRVFNMGLGMLVVVDKDDVDKVFTALKARCFLMGEIIEKKTESVAFLQGGEPANLNFVEGLST